jgi:DNA-binding MarR family transcriptional regulator
MPIEQLRDLEVLEAVARGERLTQRGLAAHLGIALGLTNLYVKRLVRKGFIKCVNVQSNRLLYLITPRGIAEKSRLTYEYMQYSLHLYRQIRQHLRSVLEPLGRAGQRVAIYGSGEAAELAYLALRDAGLEPATVFDGTGAGHFLGMTVRDVREQNHVAYDLMIVATLDPPAALVSQLVAGGIPPEKLITLRPIDGPRARAWAD